MGAQNVRTIRLDPQKKALLERSLAAWGDR